MGEGALGLEPLAKWSANITVLASDLDGEVAQSAMTVIVENGPEAPEEPEEPAAEGFVLYPNPAVDTLHIHIGTTDITASVFVYDAAVRKQIEARVAFDGDGLATLDVSALSPGVYTLVVRGDGEELRGTFVKR